MGYIGPRAGSEPTLLAFWADVLTIKPSRLPDVTMLSMLIYLRGQCRLLHSSHWNCKSVKMSFNAYTQPMPLHIYIHMVGAIAIYNAQIVQDSGHDIQCCGRDENGNITPPRFPNVITVSMSNCIWNALPERSVQTITCIYTHVYIQQKVYNRFVNNIHMKMLHYLLLKLGA